MSNVTGKCLCGAVSLSTTSMSQHIGACHCTMCRTWGGGALLAVDCGTDVKLEGGENISVYLSSVWAERGFCKHCGTHLFYRLKQNHQYFVPAGLLQDPLNLTFAHQIFIDEKPEYYAFANATENMTGAEFMSQFESPSES
jgi:hypothetical protein